MKAGTQDGSDVLKKIITDEHPGLLIPPGRRNEHERSKTKTRERRHI